MSDPIEIQGQVGEVTAALPRWVFYHLVTLTLALLLVVGAGITYVQHVTAEEGRKQCGVYTLLDGAYRLTPPTTATGKTFAVAIHQVVADLGCKE